MKQAYGVLMARESQDGPKTFERAAKAEARPLPGLPDLKSIHAVYTLARGSSDAAANILAYEMMRELALPVTSLPPSIFSLGNCVIFHHALMLVISQSGASQDLIASAKGAKAHGAHVIAITNRAASPVEAEADGVIPIAAGPERAVPATKSVIGAIGAGMNLISRLKSGYQPAIETAIRSMHGLSGLKLPAHDELVNAFVQAEHVYVIGRDTGFGAAQEVALKLKECCACHAEAYSSSEVLHGPLQLVTRPLFVLILDTGVPLTAASLDLAEQRFIESGGVVRRIRTSDVMDADFPPAAAAAALLYLLYPVIHEAALALGYNPDCPETLAKETITQ